MWIDTLDTVDIRFHHDFKTEFEQLNQSRVESKAKNIGYLRHRDCRWDSTCSRSEHFVCWRSLDIDRLNACRVKLRLDRNSQRRRPRCSSGLVCMFYRRFPWRNLMRHDFQRGKSHRWRDILDKSCPTAQTVHYGRDTRMDTKRKERGRMISNRSSITFVSAFCWAWGTMIGASSSCFSTQSRLPRLKTVARCFRLGFKNNN